MPSFLIRGLARYIAASAMAGSSGTTGFGGDFDPDYATLAIRNGVRAWRKLMPWLLPFAQATGYRIVIDNRPYADLFNMRHASDADGTPYLDKYDNALENAAMAIESIEEEERKKKEEEKERKAAEREAKRQAKQNA